jgi:hypothetical protein
VAGLIGGLLAAILLTRPAIWAGLTGISAGDWLQAGAAIIGVFLTVTATLWLEQRKREGERREEQRLIREALLMLQTTLPAASQALNADWDLDRRILETKAQYETVRIGLETLSHARQGYRVRSYNLWNALAEIEAVYTIVRARTTNEENIIRGNHVTVAVLAIAREKIEELAQNLIAPVNAAFAALQGEQL